MAVQPSTTAAPSAAAPVVVVATDQPSPSEQLEVERTQHQLQVKEQLSSVDARLEHVSQQREERGQVVGPISMLAAGYTTGLAALSISLATFAGAQQVKKTDGYKNNLDINSDDQVNGEDETTFRNLSRAMGAVSAVGFGVGIAGSIFLAKRLKERRELDPEARKLQNQRRDLRRELNYSGNVSGSGLTLGLTGRF
jgi:hypothetical protein